jgi:hypothetical protein
LIKALKDLQGKNLLDSYALGIGYTLVAIGLAITTGNAGTILSTSDLFKMLFQSSVVALSFFVLFAGDQGKHHDQYQTGGSHVLLTNILQIYCLRLKFDPIT